MARSLQSKDLDCQKMVDYGREKMDVENYNGINKKTLP